MADKQVRVNLVFNADTSKAKQSVQELYNTLEKISGMNLGNAPTNLFTSDIQKASLAAAQLKINLQEAVDTNTGKLDLNKFNKSLQKSNMTLNDYKNILTSCGPAGQKAFVQLAQSVVSADAQVIKLGARVRDLGVTLANTVKWQISSSIIHGISGALSSAYGYAQDLNKSLNNIRIVTGYNIEDMRKFAKEASQAAQALSTTATQYTDASLIFYQQGLSGEDVKERAEAVIKLASVTGESASQVSNYMTAIWNNFYDGSQSLEHYTDVLTKLGAATASSSNEIAGGLEKFSAIADTIGLSYEYAASALATITAQTRQSEEVVGTALKTIFARIQGLNMGESLEDGVDLNKYSKALQAVGISIFDTTGELKSMNNILDEMGERWGTLSKTEQTALAQTVAGVRQYNQLISLMDNWSTFEVNVDMSLNSDGSMDEQFAIYEESWEASSKRLKQSFEDMYDSIIDEDVFIGLTDFFTSLVKSSTATIDSIGGLKGVIALLGSVMLKVFSPQIGQTLDAIGLKIQRIATGTNKGLNETKSEAAAMLGEIYTNQSSNVGGVQAIAADNMAHLNEKYLSTVEKLAPYQKQIAESLLQQQNSLNEAVISQGELVKEKQKEYEIEKNKILKSQNKIEDKKNVTVSSLGTDVKYQVDNWTRTDFKDEEEKKSWENTKKNQQKTLSDLGKKANVNISSSDSGFTITGDKENAIKLQKIAVEEYTQSLEQLKLLEEGMFNSTSQVENKIGQMEALADKLKTITLDDDFNVEEYNKALQSENFSEIEGEIARASNTVEVFEMALNKQGKTLEDVFGDKAAKDIRAYSTTLKQVSDAQKKVAETSSKVANLEKKAKDPSLSAKQQKKYTEELIVAKQELKNVTQEYSAALTGNGNAQDELGSKFQEVSNYIDIMKGKTEEAKQALIALGFEEDELNNLARVCAEANIDFAALVERIAGAKNGIDQYGQQLDKLTAQSNTVGQKISKISTGISQVTMAIQAAKGIGEIWADEDLSTGEKILSTLTNMTMILPLAATVTDLVTAAQKKKNKETTKGIAATWAEIAASKAKTGQTLKETAALWGQFIAQVAVNPVMLGVAATAIAAGIGIMSAATGKHSKEVEKAAETSKKAADASREKAEASQEELTSVQDLYQEYSELNKVYEQTGEITEDLTKITTDLVNELDIEGGQLLVLQGEYDTLNEKIRENLKLKAQQNAENAETSLVDAVDAAEDSLKTKKSKDRDFFISQEEGNQKIGFFGINQETDSFFLDYLKAQGENTNWKYDEETRQLTADYTDEDQIGQLQDELERMFAAALEEAGGAKTLTDQEKLGFYQTFQRDILNKGDEVTSGAYYGIKDASNQAKESEFERKLYESNVNTIEDYERILNEFVENEPGKESLIDWLNNYIKSNSTFANLATESEILEEQKQRFEASQLSEDLSWEEFIEKYGKDTVLQAKIEPYMDENSLDNVIQAAQKAADDNAIELKVSAAKTALEGLDDVKTKEDYEAYWEIASKALEGTEWTKDTFARLSPSEQRRILEKQTRLETQKTTAQDVMAANSERRNAVKAYNDYVSEETKYYENGQKRELNDLSGYGIATSEGLLFENQSGGTIKAEDVTKIGDLISEYAGTTDFDENTAKEFLQDYQKLISYGFSDEVFNSTQFANIDEGFKQRLIDADASYIEPLTKLLGEGFMVSNLEGIDVSSLFTEGSGVFDYYKKDKFNQEAQTAWEEGDKLESSATNATANYNQTRDDYFVSDYEKEMDFKESLTNLDLDIDEVYNLKEAINDVADESEIFSEDLKDNEDALKEAAKQMTRYGKAVEAASGKMDDWKKALKGDDLVAKTKAAEEMRDVYADMFDLDGENFSKEFLESTKNAELMDKALQGSEEAYNDLQAAIAMDTIKEKFGELPNITEEAIAAITSQKIEAGDLIDFDAEADGIGAQLVDMYNKAATAAYQGGASVAEAMEEANALMQAVGFEPPDVEMEEKVIQLTGDIPDGWTPQPDGSVTTVDADGNSVVVKGVRAEKTEGGTYSYTQTILVPKGKGTIRKSTENLGGASKKSSGGGGGGGSKKKTSEARKDKTDVVDRYKEVNDKLEETQRLMDKNNTLADGLWGPDKIALMKENIKLMEKENKHLQEKYDLSKKYLAEDKAALQKAAADAGINFTFNNDDNISNYTEQMTALFNQREALLDSFGEEMDEKEQERLDEFDKKVEALKSAYELYETTLDEKKDLEEEHLEKMLKIQEEYYNVLNEELEVKVSINESDLEVIDYYLNRISDDFYQMAEAAALMVGSLDDLSNGKMGGQMAEYFDGLDIQKSYLESLEHDYNTINPETGTTYINQQQYIEGLRESRSEIINNLSAINDLDKEMLDYYANTLSMASDELDKFTSKLEHQTSVLEHYKTIMDVLGKSQDYEAMGIILEGQVTAVENELKVAEETYKLYRSQADDKRELYEQAIAAGNQVAADLYKREWEAAEEAATEAQDNMLSKTEEWAEAMKTVLRNSLDGFADELEKALTGGSSFDYINTQMERAASLQEEYLTTTNKIYETNKLMRKAQQEIDKTTNTIAKQRLKDFIKETDQLQDKSQLSKYELEIQQAKYDLLLAEIALQEAQNAKSTVRLQRDSEGNFGYVYTADQNEIDNAEQALEDAQNNLYNIGLRGATEYVEKYNQTMSAMYDTFRELEEARFNNEISQDEYNQRMLEAQEYYYQELSNFQDLYGIALDADSRVYQDAWTSAFTGMMDSSEVWKDKVIEYSENAQTAFEDWATKVDEIAQRTGLDDISEKVKEVTNDSEELKNTILGDGKKDKGVIGALEEELNAVSNLTEEYGSLRGMIQGLIKDYGGLLTAINNAEHAEAEGIEDDSKTEGAPSSTSDSNSKKADETQGAAAPSLATGSQVQVKPGTRWYEDSFGGGSSGSARGGTISYINENGSHPYNIEGMGWIKKTDIVGYDTGGYTGSWEGSYGKLAFLHQKELILNAKDTENLLQSMDFLNNIISTIDLYSANAQLGSTLMNPYINNTNTKDTLEQRVYIEASFPGVSDHNELEEAFNNLINTASQYANRK